MDAAWTLITIALAGLALSAGVYWSVLLSQVVSTVRAIPTAEAGLAVSEGDGTALGPVCVVAPAHNEEAVIGDLVRSLRAQEGVDLRVVLALDRCTDRTEAVAIEAIAGDPRFRIVRVAPGPEGWAGKVNAVWQGVLRAPEAHRARYLLFTDADCVFDPRCVRATLALLESERLDMLSLVNRLTHDAWFERLVQPAAGFELLTQFPLRRANRHRRRRAFANGQFMLFRASAYRRLGGHSAVAGELLEDLAFAREMAEREMRQWAVLSGRLVTCRMYRSWDAFRRGWKRIYIEGARRKPERLLRNAWQIRCTGVLLPVGAFAALGWGVAGVFTGVGGASPALAGVAGAFGTIAWALGAGTVYRLGGYPLWMTPGHPVGAWMVGGLLARAGRDLQKGRPVEWGGKSYRRAVR